MASRLAWGLLGALVLVMFSVLQKYQLGVSVTNPRGYVVPFVFGGAVGLGIGYAYRQREQHLVRLRTEIENRREKERRLHYLHAVTKHIVTECVERGVGTIAVGNLEGSVKTTKLAKLGTGATVGTKACTGGRLTDSRTCSRTRRKPKESPWSR